jgi:outer membrane immunogenic protein
MTRSTVLLAATLAGATAMPAFAGGPNPAPANPVIAPAPAPAPVSPDWTGFYGGAQLGYANVDSNAPGVDGDDVIGGLVAGYDYDFGSFVMGGGLDYDFADINLGGAATLESVFRAKLRGGVKIGNGLAYATGGYAMADTNTLGDEDGYFVGAGYEHMVTSNFSVGGEVLYHEFDNYGPTAIDVDATTYQVRGTFRF